MRIGIISDTHDHGTRMAAGVALLKAQGVALLIHCGDLCEAGMLEHLKGFPAGFVFGNNDDAQALEVAAKHCGVTCWGYFGEVTVGRKKIAIMHGHQMTQRNKVLKEQQYDFLLYGHSHAKADERYGKTRVINPGALSRANPKTVAVLDMEADTVAFFEVGGGD